jgi:TPR repeat protein
MSTSGSSHFTSSYQRSASVYSLDFINRPFTPPVPPIAPYLSQHHKSSTLPTDGVSIFDLNQSFLTLNLQENPSSLLPRIKTIELYRKNAKRSNDPLIQFQFAQYMLQTALLSGTTSSAKLDPSDYQITPSTTLSSSSDSISAVSPTSMSMSQQDETKIKKELLKESVSYLHKLSLAGYPDAQYLLGDAYSSGALGKTDLKESFSLFQMAAKHGHAEAAYRTALCLEEGWGASKDSRKAIQYLRQASSKSHPGAMFRLGIACFYGRLGMHLAASNEKLVRIQAEGIKWLTRATESANETFPWAPFELARIYEVGYKDLVFKDIKYAVELYVKSADLGYVSAAARLGHLYEYGELGCPQDAALSIHYYTIAALGGDPTSMLAMCAWYMVGVEPVLPRNEEEAHEWARRAADKGLAKAEYAVGFFLENGVGCERDILRSVEYYKRAARGGDQRAIDRLDNNRAQKRSNTTAVNKNSNKNGTPTSLASNGPSNLNDKKQKKLKKDKVCIIM